MNASIIVPELASAHVNNMPWHVVHTKAGQERPACDNLVRQGYTVYFPRIKVIKRVRGQQQAVLEPLFPGYVFLQPSSKAQSLAPVRSTVGVATIVRFGLEPAQMRGDALQVIRSFEAQRNAAKDADLSPLQPGERVRPPGGPGRAGLQRLQAARCRVDAVARARYRGQCERAPAHGRLLTGMTITEGTLQ
jgi:transcriptional antiterminator RfaH